MNRISSWLGPRSVAALVVLAATIVGTAVDPLTPNDVVRRGAFRVLQADFHAHTRLSDGFLSPFGLVRQARRRGLDVLSITEHNLVFPGQLGKAWADAIGGPMIIPGEEITSGRYHVIAVGMHDRVLPSSSLDSVIEQVHAQGAVAIAAHPVKLFWPSLVPSRAHFDGAELMHPIALQPQRGPGWRWDEMRTFFDEAIDNGKPLAAIGSSDYHFFSILGLCRTYVFVDRDGPDAVLDAIRDRRTVVRLPSGELDGRRDLVDLLKSEPLSEVDHDYSYRGVSSLDRVARLLGVLALFALWMLRRREPEISSLP
ncbi:MAG: CehA/McbA family metallohydrolase [Polyangiaceae bacterium]